MEPINKIFEIDEHQLESSFEKIAHCLFKDYQINANESIYRFLEIEFYYHSENKPDPHTYKATKQKTYGHWYFHYSGIDITFGSENSYGGILIRSIGKVNPEKPVEFEPICGPLRVKNEILNNFGLITDKNKFPYLENTSDPFSYDERKDFKNTERIGLNKNKEKCTAAYRYLVFEDKFPKYYRPKYNIPDHS